MISRSISFVRVQHLGTNSMGFGLVGIKGTYSASSTANKTSGKSAKTIKNIIKGDVKFQETKIQRLIKVMLKWVKNMTKWHFW